MYLKYRLDEYSSNRFDNKLLAEGFATQAEAENAVAFSTSACTFRKVPYYIGTLTGEVTKEDEETPFKDVTVKVKKELTFPDKWQHDAEAYKQTAKDLAAYNKAHGITAAQAIENFKNALLFRPRYLIEIFKQLSEFKKRISRESKN